MPLPKTAFTYMWTAQDAVAVRKPGAVTATPYQIYVSRIPDAKALEDGDRITIDPKDTGVPSVFDRFTVGQEELMWTELAKEPNLVRATTLGELFSLMAADNVNYPSPRYDLHGSLKAANIRRVFEYWGNTEYRHAIAHSAGFSPSTIDTQGDRYPLRPSGVDGALAPLKYIQKRRVRELRTTAAPSSDARKSGVASPGDVQVFRSVNIATSIANYCTKIEAELVLLEGLQSQIDDENAQRGKILAAMDVACELAQLALYSRKCTREGATVYTDLRAARSRAAEEMSDVMNGVRRSPKHEVLKSRFEVRKRLANASLVENTIALRDDLYVLSSQLYRSFRMGQAEADSVAKMFDIVTGVLQHVDDPHVTSQIAATLNLFSARPPDGEKADVMATPKGGFLHEVLRLAQAAAPAIDAAAVPKKLASTAHALRLAYIQHELVSELDQVIADVANKSTVRLNGTLDLLGKRLSAMAPKHGAKIMVAIDKGNVEELGVLKKSLGGALADERSRASSRNLATVGFLFATLDLLLVLNKYAKNGFPADQTFQSVLSEAGDVVSVVQWTLTTAQFVATMIDMMEVAKKFGGVSTKFGKIAQAISLVSSLAGAYQAYDDGGMRRWWIHMAKAASASVLLSGTKNPYILGAAYVVQFGAMWVEALETGRDARKPPVNRLLSSMIGTVQAQPFYHELSLADWSICTTLRDVRKQIWFDLEPDAQPPSPYELWIVDDRDSQASQLAEGPGGRDRSGRVLPNRTIVTNRLTRYGVSRAEIDSLYIIPKPVSRDMSGGASGASAEWNGGAGGAPGY